MTTDESALPGGPAQARSAYIRRNNSKLAPMITAAPYVVALLAALGGGIDAAFALGLDNIRGILCAVVILLADIGLGYWQGRVLASGLESQTHTPAGFGWNVLSVVRRGALTGAFVGTFNGVALQLVGFKLFSAGDIISISVVAGLALGLAAGLLVGLGIAAYLKFLHLETADKRDNAQKA